MSFILSLILFLRRSPFFCRVLRNDLQFYSGSFFFYLTDWVLFSFRYIGARHFVNFLLLQGGPESLSNCADQTDFTVKSSSCIIMHNYL
jgi:hypothetical protein